MKSIMSVIVLISLFTILSGMDDLSGTKPYLDQWVEMWNTYNLNAVERLFLNDNRLTYFSSEKEGIIRGYKAVIDHHRGFGFAPGGKRQPNKLWIEEVQSSDYGSSTVVTAIWFFKSPGKEAQRGPMTIVFVKINDGYKIAHMHFSNYQTLKSHHPILEIPEGVEAISLTGRLLFRTSPYQNTEKKYLHHKQIYEDNPGLPENIIWYGRWTAYRGHFREAIGIFTEGIKKFPEDPRFYRHRGHRYITIRMFDKAIGDLNKAASLIKGTKDRVEPDGQPNARNIPVSTLHTNIYYHLGLAHYLKNDLKEALSAYRMCIEASTNDDMLVATTHWLYMTLRRLGKENEAEEALKTISRDMNVIENMSYHQLCLFYKGMISEKEITGENFSNIMNDAAAYGIANWYLYSNESHKAKIRLEELLKGKVWGSFGYIAAEADYKRKFL